MQACYLPEVAVILIAAQLTQTDYDGQPILDL